MYCIHSVELNFEGTEHSDHYFSTLLALYPVTYAPNFFLTLHPQNKQQTFGNKNVLSYRWVSTYRRVFPQGCICLHWHRIDSCSQRIDCEPFVLFPYALNITSSRMNLLQVQGIVEQFIRVFRLTLLCVDSYLEKIEQHHIKGASLLLFPNLPQSSFGYACMTLPGKHYLHDQGLNLSRCLDTALPDSLNLDCWKSIGTNISGYKIHYLSVTHSYVFHADDRKGVFTFEEHT